jgi:putative transposase
VQFPSGTISVASFPAIAPREIIGIDPGLKDVVVTSDGEKFAANRSYRDIEEKIANAQKRGHKKQAKHFHAKAKNQRMNFIHQTSTYLVKNYQIIKIGDVSLSFLRAGNHAKSALDGGWGLLKAQLHTKGRRAGRWVNDVPEKYSTQTCSTCWALTGPTGLIGLNVRQWICCACGTKHDRDVNAAMIHAAPRCCSVR